MLDKWRDYEPHLQELRRALIRYFWVFLIAFALCYWYSDEIFYFLAKPLINLWTQKNKSRSFIYTGVSEAFLTYVRLSAFAGICLSFPYLIFEIWKFIAPGLYQNERRFFFSLLWLTPLLFLVGGYFSYHYVLPKAYEFFMSFESQKEVLGSIRMEVRVQEYLSFVTTLLFVFGLCFELPALFILLSKVGILTSQSLISRWRLAVVGIFALSAFITPPDILSMLFLSIPLIGLYGFSIVLIKIFENK